MIEIGDGHRPSRSVNIGQASNAFVFNIPMAITTMNKSAGSVEAGDARR